MNPKRIIGYILLLIITGIIVWFLTRDVIASTCYLNQVLIVIAMLIIVTLAWIWSMYPDKTPIKW